MTIEAKVPPFDGGDEVLIWDSERCEYFGPEPGERTRDYRSAYPHDRRVADAIASSGRGRFVITGLDGWIKHNGNKCPLPPDMDAEAILRYGLCSCPNPAWSWDWGQDKGSGTIEYYRPNPEFEHQEPPTPQKTQIGGTHYAEMPIQPHEYITANGLCWEAANVVKYVSRAGRKGSAEVDIRKAIHYAEMWLERLEREPGE